MRIRIYMGKCVKYTRLNWTVEKGLRTDRSHHFSECARFMARTENFSFLFCIFLNAGGALGMKIEGKINNRHFDCDELTQGDTKKFC